MSRRRVVLVAPFDDAAHAHSALRRRALERLGCDVHPVPADRERGLSRLLRRRFATRLEQAVSRDPDIVLVLGMPDLERPAIERLRRDRRAVWVNWIPGGLPVLRELGPSLPAYDLLVAVGTDVAARLREETGRSVPVLPFASDPSIYRPPARRQQQYRANVVFAGRATRQREVLLSHLADFGLALWGPGWRQMALRDYCRGETLATGEFVRAYSGASVAVNIHDDRDSAGGTACNQRLFEVAALGVPQVVDWREDLPRWFLPGEEVVTYRDGDELRRAVETLIHDPHRGQRYGDAARARVLREHTYMHRMTELLSVIDRRKREGDGRSETRDTPPGTAPPSRGA